MRALDLASILHTDTSQLSRWENDRGLPRADFIAKIAEATGVSERWLITGDGDGPEVHPLAEMDAT